MSTRGSFIIRRGDEAKELYISADAYPDGAGRDAVRLIKSLDLDRLFDLLMTEDDVFPHEVGLFLGYPPGDVRSFMKDTRHGVKCTGCWKAYGNEEEARKTFAKFRKCTDVYRRELSRGRSLLQLTVRTDLKRRTGYS